ncbi:MAG: CPBP family intramembrane metalloprotease [Gemmatimonadetes bacterium]|nr:CPBP family intramembrane metalloprotease [Gemmatimonadota bacterium]
MAYVLLTFVVSWATWFAAAGLAGGHGGGLLGLGGPLFLLGVFAPALVAVALTYGGSGREGVVRLLAPIGRWRVDVRWYLIALFYFIAIKLSAALLHRLAKGEWPEFGETSVLLMIGAIFVSTWAQAGEEVGWRGYLLPHLATRVGLGAASIGLGVVWALWHLPLFYLDGSGSTGQSFPLYASHVTALSVAMAWLYWRTGRSLLLVMVMHAAVNNTTGVVASAVPGASDVWTLSGSLVGWGTAGLSWLVGILMLLDMRGATLEPTP